MDLLVTPHGNIAVSAQAEAGCALDELAAAFQQGRACGLLKLLDRPLPPTAVGGLRFFTTFVNAFMRYVCVYADSDPWVVPLDGFEVARFSAAVPPMVGCDYITPLWLSELCHEMLAYLTAEMVGAGLTPRGFLARRMPGWESVGLVHFHLAENQKEPTHPFAFLATYSVRVADKARLQHRPLSAALGDALRRAESHALAARLMAPLHKASAMSGFVKYLLTDNRLLRQLFLTAREAFAFLSEIEAIEQAGIVCRVPASWRKGRPAQAKVLVTLGSDAGKKQQGFGGLFDFKVSLALGEEALSEQEARALLAGDEPLVLVRGAWVAVDGAALQDLMVRLRTAMGLVEGRGVSLGEAMRMLQGFSRLPSTLNGAALAAGAAELCQFAAGEQLQKILEANKLAETSGKLQSELDAVLKSHLKADLRPYQRDGVLWLAALWQQAQGGCLADDMGLGKTIQVIALLLFAKAQSLTEASEPNPPSLLVVPASLLFNWQAEIRRFAPSLTYSVLHPSSPLAAGDGAEAVDLVITTYGMLMRTAALSQRDWHMVIADEAQNIKNAQTKKAQLLRHLHARVRFALTGTPVENSIADLWSIFAFACPGLLGGAKEFNEQAERLAQSPDGFAPLKRLIAPYLLRRKKTDRSIINDLPDKIEMRVECFLTKRQAQLYQKQVASMGRDLKEAKDDVRRKGVVLANLMKLKQICNHPSQAIGDQQYLPAHSGKFARLYEIAAKIAARQEKLLVFTQYREITDILAHTLAGVFGRTGALLHGGIDVDARRQLVERFARDDGPPFFILSLKAGGAGLNLTAAAHVIHFDRWWNPAVEDQATDRAFRIGQRQNVMVHKFVCPGTIEDRIDRMLKAKGELAFDIIDGLPRLPLGRMNDEELLGLVALDEGAVADDNENEEQE